MEFNFINMSFEDVAALVKDFSHSHPIAFVAAMFLVFCVAVYFMYRRVKKGDEERRNSRATKILKDLVCHNQGKIAEYEYISSMFHKMLRIEVEKRNPDLGAIREKLATLENYCVRNMRRACHENFKYLHIYYNARYPTPPRLCMKSNRSPADMTPDAQNRIFTLARCEQSRRNSGGDGCAVSENTGFQKISDYGRYYLEQNIPEAVKGDGKYINPRLNSSAALQYKAGFFLKLRTYGARKFFNKKVFDRDWISCWKERKDKSSDKEAYKATLIIPITFWNNTGLNEDFLTGLGLFRTTDFQGGNARSILGYLCVDHTDAKYFDVDYDPDICYVVADLLSLYMVSLVNYTASSNTYKKAVKLLAGC